MQTVNKLYITPSEGTGKLPFQFRDTENISLPLLLLLLLLLVLKKKMKEGRVGAVAMACLVLGLVMGQSRAQFFECYTKCFIFCIIIPDHTTSSCSLQCLRDCIIPPPVNYTTNNTNLFCKLGCASSLCTNFSTKQNPGGKQVVKCVGSCSDMCTQNYSSP